MDLANLSTVGATARNAAENDAVIAGCQYLVERLHSSICVGAS